MTARWVFALVLAALAACDEPLVIRPVIDYPTGALDPFARSEIIELSIALAGDDENLVNAVFEKGEPLEIPGAPYGENLVIHMTGFNGAVVAYGRTCPFSIQPGPDQPLAPHLYFAPTVTWAPAGLPASAERRGGTAIRYRDSGIFVGGLDNASAPVIGIDQFDAQLGRFEQVVELEPRRFGSAALLGDGRIVIGGGSDPSTGNPMSLLELVTVEDRNIDRVDAGPLAGLNSSAFTTLSDGKIVSFGGRNAQNVPEDDLVEISPDGLSVTLRVLNRAKLAVPRYHHSATALSDDSGAAVLIAGGLSAPNTVVETAELFKPLLEELAPGFAPRMVVPRYGHQAVRMPDGSVLIIGGSDALGNPVRTLELFSLDQGFREVGSLPQTAGITDFTATPLPDGRVLIAAGKNDMNAVVNTAFIVRLDTLGGDIDILTTGGLETPRSQHQATLLCDGTVMLTGGTLFEAAAERYNPVSAGRR